ncbi:MAG: flagellar hook capping protein [Pseudogulbenkiania sp.]|nr:flagellar hook capping protein [Pseudogulbenkiania sp.]
MASTTVTNSSASNPYAFLNASSSSSSSATSSQNIQDRFLTLLTAQLKSQDPLNPMENNEITSQMAQISQVTGLESLNTSFKTLLQSQYDTQALLAASLVGKTAMIDGNTLTLSEGGSAQGGVMLDAAAKNLEITIKDQSGVVVDVVTMTDVGSGLTTFSWDGVDSSGNPVAAGNYTFSVAANNGDSSASAAVQVQRLSNQHVDAVVWDKGSPYIVTPQGGRVAIADIVQLS